MSFPFKIPFAASGDQSTVPDSDLTGSVNFTDGYTPDYQADPSLDPNAKLIERDKFNFLMNKVTGAVGEIQRQGAADWYADLAPYDLNAEVFYNGKRWRSTIANNSAVPGAGPEWLDVTPGTAAARRVASPAEAIAGTAGPLLDAAGGHSAFKQFGFGTQGPQTDAYNGSPPTTAESITRVWRNTSADGIAPAFASSFHFAGGPQWGRLRIIGSAAAPIRAFVEGGLSVGADLGRKQAEIFHSANMQPDLFNGLNSPRLMRNVSGAFIGDNDNTAGSGLRFCDFSAAGVLTASATAGTGTWKNVSGTSLADTEYGLFVRIA